MKIIVFILIIALTGPGASCGSQAIVEATKYRFAIDNDDQQHLGYKRWEMDEDQSVISICLYRDFAYLADSYHSNVKRVDLHSGQLISSPHISSLQYAWPTDVAVIDSSVLVSCVVDSIYVLELNLEPRMSFPIEGRHQKFFWRVTDSTLDVSIVNDETTVSVGKDSTIGTYRFGMSPLPWSSAHGKEYSTFEKNGRHFFECEYFQLELEDSLPPFRDKYDAINVDFDSSRLVYYDVDEKQFTLYVYDVPKKNRKPRAEAADTLRGKEQ